MQDRVDSKFAQALNGELPLWEQEGVITSEQAQQLRFRYQNAAANAVTLRRHTRMSVVMSILGSLLLGVGAVLVLASNWQSISAWIKLILLTAITLGTYYAGFRMAHQTRSHPALGGALLFLGTLFYGASVFLVGQMFNIRIEWAHGLLVWGFGILPLAYVLNSSPILTESIFAIGLWILLVAGNTSAYGVGLFGTAVVLGVLLFAIGEVHQLRWPDRRLNAHYFWAGIVLVLVTSFINTFSIGEMLYGYGQDMTLGTFITSFAICASIVATVLLAITAVKTFRNARIEIYFYLLILAAMTFGLLTLFAPYVISKMHTDLVYHIFFAVLIISTIALGIKRSNEALVNIGLVFFTIDVIRLYFDWSMRLITGGVAFIAGGVVLLIIAAIFESARRRFAAQIHANGGN